MRPPALLRLPPRSPAPSRTRLPAGGPTPISLARSPLRQSPPKLGARSRRTASSIRGSARGCSLLRRSRAEWTCRWLSGGSERQRRTQGSSTSLDQATIRCAARSPLSGKAWRCRTWRRLGAGRKRRCWRRSTRRPISTTWSASYWKGRRWSYVSSASQMRGTKPVQKPVQGKKKRPACTDTDRRISYVHVRYSNDRGGSRTHDLRIKSSYPARTTTPKPAILKASCPRLGTA